MILASDNTYDDFAYTNGVPNESLAANISGGIVNMFFNDLTNDGTGNPIQEDALLLSFAVNGSTPFPNRNQEQPGVPAIDPGVTITADLFYANDGYLYRDDGNSIGDALDNGAVGSMTLTTSVIEDKDENGERDPGTIPGQYMPGDPAPSGNGLGYFDPGPDNRGDTPATTLIRNINNWGACDGSFFDWKNNNDQLCNSGDTGRDLIPRPVDILALQTLQEVENGAGDAALLARTVVPERAGLTIAVSEPATIGMFGFLLASLGFIRRRK